MRIGAVKDWVKPGDSEMFGLIKLKPMQLAILRCNRQHDVLVNLPTGFGKSLLFQYPASKLHGRCIVVIVPLKALLWDCLKEAELHGLTASECDANMVRNYQKSSDLPQLLFLTPERLFQSQTVMFFLDYLHSEKKIEMFVVDQAHCISQWGSDFRTDYAKLGKIKEIFPGARILGMSATIPPEALKDLISKLQIVGCYYFQSSSNRPNLIYEVLKTETKLVAAEIVTYLKSKNMMNEMGIVYCQTIKKAEEIWKELKKAKVDCCLFHSKLSEGERSNNFDDFMSEKTKCIVATICFGMGVNKKNIRYVINVGVSQSAENYYQESGRAGRDGLPSYCLLLTYASDTSPLQFLIQKSIKKKALVSRKLYKLKQLKDYTNAVDCRKKVLFKLLGQEFSRDQCKKTCDFCIGGGKEMVYDVVDYSQKGFTIIEELQKNNLRITKIQLAGFLKGKELPHKFMNDKLRPLFQIFKKSEGSHAELLLDTLMEKGLLTFESKKVGSGARQRYVDYLKPCSKMVLSKQRKQGIDVKIPKSKYPEPEPARKLDQDNKFSKYLTKKTSSLTSLEFEKEFQYKEEVPKQVQVDQEDDLKEIKMIEMGPDYQNYLDELFPENLEMENIYERQSASFDEDILKDDEEGHQAVSFELDLDQTQLERPLEKEQPQKPEPIKWKNAENSQIAKTEEKNGDSDCDSDKSLLELIKKKKADLARKSQAERKEKQVVIRKKAQSFEFL